MSSDCFILRFICQGFRFPHVTIILIKLIRQRAWRSLGFPSFHFPFVSYSLGTNHRCLGSALAGFHIRGSRDYTMTHEIRWEKHAWFAWHLRPIRIRWLTRYRNMLPFSAIYTFSHLPFVGCRLTRCCSEASNRLLLHKSVRVFDGLVKTLDTSTKFIHRYTKNGAILVLPVLVLRSAGLKIRPADGNTHQNKPWNSTVSNKFFTYVVARKMVQGTINSFPWLFLKIIQR